MILLMESFPADKNSGILRDVESTAGFIFHKNMKLLIAIQDVLVLIAVTGEYILDQRLSFVHDELVFIPAKFDFTETSV